MALDHDAYARLLALRTGLRRFLHWSEQQAQSAGLTPAQHQLLLAVRGHDDDRGPTIGEVADYLLLQHHSAVGLVNRAVAAGLVSRHRDPADQRVARLALTTGGAERLEALSALTLEELDRLARQVPDSWKDLVGVTRGASPAGGAAPVTVSVARAYDDIGARARGGAVLVDRLWPRGLAKSEAPFDHWNKDVAPSTELRTWYGHVSERFDEFAARYRRELARPPADAGLVQLRALAARRRVTLVTATKDVEHSGAVVLREVLAGR